MVADYNVLAESPLNYFIGDLLSSEGQMKPDYPDAFKICNWIFMDKDGCENYWARPYGDYFMEVYVCKF